VKQFQMVCIQSEEARTWRMRVDGFSILLAILAALMCSPWAFPAQGAAHSEGQMVSAPAGDLTPDEIIRRFAAKETEFYEAWMQYAYHQVAEIRLLSVNGFPSREKMTTISDVVFKDDGSRDIIIRRRASNLKSVVYTMEDEEVINNLQPFALTEKELPLYNLEFLGKERVDELDCYVFSVTPRNLKGNRFYFQGKIWVDDLDLQIVRTVGKPVPQKKGNQFPDFETIRQMIDNKYWFPAWTHAESVLNFGGDKVHIEETITYSDYKRFGSNAKIISVSPAENNEK
jgi:hypothetical protein